MEELTLEGVQTEVLDALKAIKSDWTAKYDESKAAGADTGKAVTDLRKTIDNAVKRIEEAEALLAKPGFVERNHAGEVKSIGDIVSECKAVRDNFGDGQSVNWQGKLRVPIENIDIDGKKYGTFFPERLGIIKALVPELKTTITSAAVGSSTPGILTPQRIPGIVKPPQPRIRVRDLIPRLPTTANAIDFVKENVFTNAAAASPQIETVAKAESGITFTVDSENVRTLAHWLPAARQVLDDFVGLGAYIDQRLLDGLMDEEDDQILRGDGTGQNLSGLSNEADAYTDVTYDETGDTALDKLVRMITELEDSNHEPSGFILHPRNWRIVQTIKADYGGGTGTGPYVMGGPQATNPNFVWGLPVATSPRMTAGHVFCGDFVRYVILWDRMQSRVDISTEHSDYFIRNMVAIRAEERVALTTLRGDAVLYESSI